MVNAAYTGQKHHHNVPPIKMWWQQHTIHKH